MPSLQELCQQNITTSIYNMPPVMQEMVIGETKEQIKEQIRKELIAEIRAEEKVRKQLLNDVTFLIPDIMKDIIFTMTNHNVSRKNFYETWPNIPTSTIQAAINIAENTVSEMEEHYVYNSFSTNNNMYYEDESEDDY